jgi:hypothetical protein
MKKKFFILFAVLLSMTLQAAAPWDGTTIATTFAGGTGTLANPYQISSPAELAYLSQSVNGGNTYATNYFILTSDLDLNSKSWTPIGNATTSFKGTFDGNSHLISNLTVNLPTTTGVGLFGYIDGAFIKKLGIVGVSTIIGQAWVGGIIGRCILYPGGNFVSDCFSNATVSASGERVAGIVGSIRSAQSGDPYLANMITNCYSTGNITGSSYVAGIVGHIEYKTAGKGTVTISNSYSTGTMTATGTGALNGGIVTAAVVNVANSYYINGDAANANGASQQTADVMKTADFVTALNNGGTAWKADFAGSNSINNGFPILAWRNLSTDVKSTLISNGRVTVIGKTVKIEAPVSINNMELYNFSGQLVETQHINYAANNVSFDVEHAGIYLLIAHTAEGQQTQKIIIK